MNSKVIQSNIAYVAIIQGDAVRLDPKVTVTLYSAVESDLWVEASCVKLNYCYACCSEMTLLFKKHVCSETAELVPESP